MLYDILNISTLQTFSSSRKGHFPRVTVCDFTASSLFFLSSYVLNHFSFAFSLKGLQIRAAGQLHRGMRASTEHGLNDKKSIYSTHPNLPCHFLVQRENLRFLLLLALPSAAAQLLFHRPLAHSHPESSFVFPPTAEHPGKCSPAILFIKFTCF